MWNCPMPMSSMSSLSFRLLLTIPPPHRSASSRLSGTRLRDGCSWDPVELRAAPRFFPPSGLPGFAAPGEASLTFPHRGRTKRAVFPGRTAGPDRRSRSEEDEPVGRSWYISGTGFLLRDPGSRHSRTGPYGRMHLRLFLMDRSCGTPAEAAARGSRSRFCGCGSGMRGRVPFPGPGEEIRVFNARNLRDVEGLVPQETSLLQDGI